MKRIVALSVAIIESSVLAGTATERYADAAAATAQTNAQIYADAKIASATNGIDAKIASSTNGIPEEIHAVDVTANAARDAATNSIKVAQSAAVTANAASNVATTASLSLASEIVTRQNADAEHTADIAGEKSARQMADDLLAKQVAGAINAVSNKADAAALAVETEARKTADEMHGLAINSKQDTLVSGTNIKTINGQSVLGGGNLIVSGGEGFDTNAVKSIIESVVGGTNTLIHTLAPSTNYTDSTATALRGEIAVKQDKISDYTSTNAVKQIVSAEGYIKTYTETDPIWTANSNNFATALLDVAERTTVTKITNTMSAVEFDFKSGTNLSKTLYENMTNIIHHFGGSVKNPINFQ